MRRFAQLLQGRAPMRLAWGLLPLSVTIYQVSAKLIANGARQAPPWAGLMAILTNPLFIVLIASEIAGFVLWMYVLARMQLSEAFPLSAISYVFVLLASWSVLHEGGSVSQVVGSAAIVIGVWLIGRQPERDL